ncbi:hypothetical protein [Nitrobacter sp. JJSN]
MPAADMGAHQISATAIGRHACQQVRLRRPDDKAPAGSQYLLA